MYNGLKSIRRERATLERNRVIMTSMMEDENLSDLMQDAIPGSYVESVDDSDIEKLIANLPESDMEDEDIERVLKADMDLDVDGILGIEDSPSVEIDE